MILGHARCGVRRDNGKAGDGLAAVALPHIVDASQGKGRCPGARVDRPLLLRVKLLPFVVAGTRQRFVLNGSRKNGLVFTVSTRALNVESRWSSFSGLFHQKGTRPQRISLSSRAPSFATTTSAGSVGQTLNRGWKFGIAAGAVSRLSAWICCHV